MAATKRVAKVTEVPAEARFEAFVRKFEEEIALRLNTFKTGTPEWAALYDVYMATIAARKAASV